MFVIGVIVGMVVCFVTMAVLHGTSRQHPECRRCAERDCPNEIEREEATVGDRWDGLS